MAFLRNHFFRNLFLKKDIISLIDFYTKKLSLQPEKVIGFYRYLKAVTGSFLVIYKNTILKE